jgi:hypothetical protein
MKSHVRTSFVAALLTSACATAPHTKVGEQTRSAAGAVSAPDCREVLARSVQDSGGGPVSIYVSLANNASFPEADARALANAIAAHFERPVIAQYPILGMRFTSGALAFFGVEGEFRAVLHRDGRLTSATVSATTLLPVLDSAVVRAITAVDSPSDDRPIPPSITADSIGIKVRLHDTETPPISAALYPVKFARRTITRPLRDAAGNGFHALLTTDAPSSSDTGFLTLHFVVDGAGHVDRGTIQILHGGTDRMWRAIPPVVLSKSYTPAEIDGCPIATIVVRRIDFK